MATTTTQVISTVDLVASTSYGAVVTPLLDVDHLSIMGLALKIDTAASVTGLTFTVQTQMGASGAWYDLYRDNAGTFEPEEYTIPLSASATGLLRAIRLAGEGIKAMRLNFKGVGGNVTIKTIDAVYEQPTVR